MLREENLCMRLRRIEGVELVRDSHGQTFLSTLCVEANKEAIDRVVSSPTMEFSIARKLEDLAYNLIHGYS